MTDYIEEIYLQFRPMVETLLRMNIDYSKKPNETELKIVKNWLDKYMGSEILENDFFKSLYYQVLDHSYLKKVEIEELEDHDNMEPPFLEEFIGKKVVIWILKGTSAFSENISIDENKLDNRYAKKNFKILLDALRFPDEVQNIFIGEKNYRFNSLKHPLDFLEAIYYEKRGCLKNEKDIIKKFCSEGSWQERYEDLIQLIKLWEIKQENGRIKKEIDFEKYHKTVELFLKLIPVISEDNVLKTIRQYESEQDMIRQVLYDYYRDESLDCTDNYLKALDQMGILIKKIKKVVDKIQKGEFGRTQKEFLMDKFEDYLDKIFEDCDGFFNAIEEFEEKFAGKNVDKPEFEYCQHIWEDE